MRFRFPVLLAVLFILGSSLNLSASAPAPLPFTLTGTGQILVPVMVNESGPYLFVFDTGSNRSVVSDTLAARLSLQPVAVSEVVTASGSVQSPVVKLQSISLGSHRTPAVLAPVISADRIQTISPKAEGIVGQDVLIDAHYTLDYRRKTVIWHGDAVDSGSGIRLALRRSEGRLIVELPQSSRREDLALLVPDSGASALVLFQHDGRTAIPATAIGDSVKTSTVTGDIAMRGALVPKLRIGSGTFWDQPAVLIPSPGTQLEQRVDGLLPLSMFSSVTFSGRGNYLTIRP